MEACLLPALHSHGSGSPDTSEPRPEPEPGERCSCEEKGEERGFARDHRSRPGSRQERRGPAAHLPSEREMRARAKASSARARRSMLGLLEEEEAGAALLVPAAAALCWRPHRPSRYRGAGGGGRRARGSS